MKTLNWKLLVGLFIAALGVYGIGLFIGIMNVDAAQYAYMGREMTERGSYLIIKEHLGHYLDKPPMIFWLSSLSFRIFGFTDFAYRFPSFLFTLLGIYSTFRLGKLLYNQKVAVYSALILSTCQAYFLINHDVRTDTILAGSVIFSIWQIFDFTQTRKASSFLLGFSGIAVSMLTKGPVGAMVPVLALGTHFLLKKEWNNIFRWQWIPGMILVLILLMPMLWGLYMHHVVYPGNPLYQNDRFYGIRFYFWIQSFGRITGSSTWQNSHDPFFFVHSFIWSFLPWSLITLIGIYRGITGLFRKTVRIDPKSEWITLSGVVLTMIAFSFSRYVLPHYIFVFYPLAAILTAKTVAEILENPGRLTVGIFWIQFANVAVIWITGFLILIYVFPARSFYLWLVFVMAAILSLLFMSARNATEVRVIVPSVLAIVGINFILNTHFYPELLKFQSDIPAALIINKSNVPRERVYTYNFYRYSLEFKTGKFNAKVRDSSVLRTLIRQKNLWVFTDQASIGFVRSIDSLPKKVYVLDDYPVTLLTGKFLNAKTREKELKKTYLLYY